jgi:hypothetical protein
LTKAFDPMTDNASYNVQSAPGERAISVDSEHFKVRLLVPILTIAVTVAAHFIGMRVLDELVGDNVSPLCLMLPIDLAVLLGAGTLIERMLKRALPSQRTGRLSDEAVALDDARRNPPDVRKIYWDRLVNVNAWYFVIKRRTRVPKGWYCMAVHLLQDDTELIFYTFMSPKDAEALPTYSQFVRLRPRKETETQTDLRQIATQRRLLKLEDARWMDGAEIGADDFRALLAHIEARAAVWA